MATYLLRYNAETRGPALPICSEDAWHLATWSTHRDMPYVVEVKPLT